MPLQPVFYRGTSHFYILQILDKYYTVAWISVSAIYIVYVRNFLPSQLIILDHYDKTLYQKYFDKYDYYIILL